MVVFGESGVGKELVAHAIHRLGPRRDKPFVQINCAAFYESLLESELFGHVRGAFTGAHRHRIGRFAEVKLLRVLETRAFERVGDNQPLPVNARLISATNQDLEGLAREGLFRHGFFFRINVIPVQAPPVRSASRG